MTKKLLLLLPILLLMVGSSFSLDKPESKGWCGSEKPNADWENQIQHIIQMQQAQHAANGREQQIAYTIPVIVHICYYQNTTSQNISATRVQQQINTLNADYAGTGLNSGSLPSAFAAVKANSNITFCLAKLDLNNNVLAEPGIERINAQTRGWGNPGTTGWSRDLIDNTIKKTTIWDPNYYLNIWVVPGIESTGSGTILGYATFPGMSGLPGMPTGAGNALNDGFVCRASYFGNNGASLGRTSTHEIGHWLGLRHIWGDDSCGTDYVDDTPTALEENYTCYTSAHVTCGNAPNGDMFQNFMDYTGDNCMALFTNGQSARFQAVMQFADFRKNLPNSPVCDTVKQKPVARFTSLKQNAALCATSQKFDFTDKSLFKPTTWSWTFQGGTPSTSTVQNPTNITFNTVGFHDVTLVVTNARGTSTITQQVNVPIVGTATFPFSENFESAYFPPLGWETVNRNGNAAINWDVRNGYSGYGIGNRSMIFDNTSLDGKYKKDDIQTPKIDLTGVTSAKLKFDVAYAPFYGDAGAGVDQFLWDTLEVLITDNCQGTTQSIYRKGETNLATYPAGTGPEFYPTASQWRSDTVTIPAAYLNKPNIQLIFRNYGDYGHTIYIDNINLFSPVTTPTATASFTLSDTVFCVGGSTTLTSTSTANNGGTLDSIRWTITGGTPSTSTSTTVSPVFNTAGTYSISLIAYTHSGATVIPSTVVTKTVRVKAKPTVGVNSPAICSGATATLTATGATTYTWTGGLTGNPSTTPVLTSNASYTVTGTTDGCTNTAVATVTVNARPTVSVNSPTICSGTTATLTATGADSYSWTGGLTGNPATTPALTSNASYTVTGTSSGCTNTAVATVTVTALPNVGVNSPTICSGTTATLTATGATSYTWTGGLTGNPATTPVLTSNASYTVTGTANGCTKTAVATVTVTTPPTVSVNSPTICSGQTATLTASGNATTYTWTGLTGNPATTPALTSNTSYTVTGTTGTCSATAVATVTVTALPTVSVNNPTICSGQTATLTANGATTYTWTGGLTGNPATTPALTSNTSYTVTGTSSGCTNTAVATVTVTPLPNVTVNSPSICAGSTATLTATGATSYSWTGGLSGNPVTTPVLNTTTSYTVTGTTGSCSKTAVATVTVNTTAPTVTITPNPASVCNGDPITLTANGADNYTWSQGGSTTNTYTFTPSGNVTVSVSGTLTGCTSAGNASVNVTVKPKPTVGVNSPSICSGTTATLTANGATTYTWTGGLSGNPATTPALTSNTSYTVTGTTDGCTGTAVAAVTVNALPTVSVNSPSICSGETATLTASGNATSYSWTGGLSGNPVTTPALTSNTSYTVTGTSGSCTATAVANVSVNATPAQSTISQGAGFDTIFSSTVVAGATYKWYLNGSTTPVATTSTPYYKFTTVGLYTVVVVSSSNCSSPISASFSTQPPLGVKTSDNVKVLQIYPNPTDGRLILNIGLSKLSNVQMKIYSSEGREMYSNVIGLTKEINQELNLNSYAKGIYILKLQVDDETIYQKVVRQ
ncbi:MAG: M43 family zinc metalloprotease [Chitinophagales bacterium]